jgi:hypothetical protein
MTLAPVIGEVLPLTLPISISPLTIVAVILMLLSPIARRTGPGFLLGWTVGIAGPAIVFTVIASALPPRPEGADGPDLVRGLIQSVLAVLLLVLAVKQWRTRPVQGQDPTLPRWMATIDSFTFVRAVGLGLLLSAPRPKNLVMAANAGMIIGSAGLSTASTVVATGAFIVCAASTVFIPVVAYLLAADRLRGPLETVRAWLVRENAVITSVLLFVIGGLMIGKALGSF